jgi:hypothetical protein
MRSIFLDCTSVLTLVLPDRKAILPADAYLIAKQSFSRMRNMRAGVGQATAARKRGGKSGLLGQGAR